MNNPVELLGEQRIKGVKFERMRLEGSAGDQRAVAFEPKQVNTMDCELLIKSIGYKSQPIEGIPFNTKTHTIPNLMGCVLNDKDEPQPGLYVAGWLKRGPSGIIDATLRDSVETFRIIKHHLDNEMLPEKHTKPEDVQRAILENAANH